MHVDRETVAGAAAAASRLGLPDPSALSPDSIRAMARRKAALDKDGRWAPAWSAYLDARRLGGIPEEALDAVWPMFEVFDLVLDGTMAEVEHMRRDGRIAAMLAYDAGVRALANAAALPADAVATLAEPVRLLRARKPGKA